MPTGIYKRKPLTEEHKINISKGMKGVNVWMFDKTGNKNNFYGKKHKVETRKKLSELLKKQWANGIRKGRKLNTESKKKISRSLTGKKQSLETIEKRVSKFRNENHFNWKGENAGYGSKHQWVRKYFGEPQKCEHCGTEEKRKYHWANISKEYKRTVADWLRLCVPCHSKYDHGRI